MAQTLSPDFPIDPVTTSGTELADILNRLASSIDTTNSGATPPPDVSPGMMWLDTSSGGEGILRMRNAANTGWIAMANPADPNVPASALTPYAKTTDMAAADNLRVLKTGDTMTGTLVVPAVTLNGSNLATLISNAQATANAAMPKAGGTFTGDVICAGNVTVNGAGGISSPKGIKLSADGNFTIYEGPGQRVFVFLPNYYFTMNTASGDFTWSIPAGAVWTARASDRAFIFGASAYKPGGGAWADSSDERIKENIQPFTQGLDAILSLEPVSYTFKAGTGRDTTRRYIRLLAQKAKVGFPELVTVAPGACGDIELEDLHSLDESPVLWALVNSIKTLNGRIAALETHA